MRVAEDRIVMPRWMPWAFVGFAIYLLLVGGSAAFVIAQNRILFNDLKKSEQIDDAKECVDDHEEHDQIEAAIDITPAALVEISAADTEDPPDPEQIELFLGSISRRVEETIETPDCNREEAIEELMRLGIQ